MFSKNAYIHTGSSSYTTGKELAQVYIAKSGQAWSNWVPERRKSSTWDDWSVLQVLFTKVQERYVIHYLFFKTIYFYYPILVSVWTLHVEILDTKKESFIILFCTIRFFPMVRGFLYSSLFHCKFLFFVIKMQLRTSYETFRFLVLLYTWLVYLYFSSVSAF